MTLLPFFITETFITSISARELLGILLQYSTVVYYSLEMVPYPSMVRSFTMQHVIFRVVSIRCLQLKMS